MRVALASSMFTWSVIALLPAVTVSKIQIVDDGTILTDVEAKTFVGAARCTCGSSFEVRFDVATSGEEGELAVARGKRCVDSEQRLSDSCDILWRGSLSGLTQVEFEVQVADIADCEGGSSSEGIIVLADPDDEDLWQELTSIDLPADTKAPPPPKNAKVLGGEGLAEVAFEKADTKDMVEYQVLCAKAGEPVLDDPPEAAFVSAYDLCGAGDATLSQSHVCGESAGGTDSVTVLGLENGQTYHFWVVSIDDFGNASTLADAGEATPAPELDLWEVYQKNGGKADGGHCFVATAAFGDYDHPQVVILRGFRDRVLKQSEVGRELIGFYYAESPPLAEWIARSPLRRRMAQLILWPITLLAAGLTP